MSHLSLTYCFIFITAMNKLDRKLEKRCSDVEKNLGEKYELLHMCQMLQFLLTLHLGQFSRYHLYTS